MAGPTGNVSGAIKSVMAVSNTTATDANQSQNTQDTTTQNALIKGRSSTMLTGGRGLGLGDTGTTSKFLLGN